MIVKTISVTYGRKLGLPNFSSVQSSITLWADLEEGESEEYSVLALREMAKNNVMDELAPYSEKIKAKTENLFMGLPKELQEIINAD